MTSHVLYAYAVGSEFSEIAPALMERVEAFIAGRRWACPEISAMDQPRTAEDWEIGLNLALPGPSEEKPGWYADVEAVVVFCVELRREFGCDFVVGISDSRTGCAEDVIAIDSERPDSEYLRRFIGTEPPRACGG